MANDKTDDYFIKNAIHCWLHYFPEHKWTPIYKELAQRDTFTTASKPQPRPARRRRTSKDANA